MDGRNAKTNTFAGTGGTSASKPGICGEGKGGRRSAMIALGVRYLTGRSVAANVAVGRQAEWPPHPGRVFMAMAAVHFETRGDDSERAALEWLEREPVPAICAS